MTMLLLLLNNKIFLCSLTWLSHKIASNFTLFDESDWSFTELLSVTQVNVNVHTALRQINHMMTDHCSTFHSVLCGGYRP